MQQNLIYLLNRIWNNVIAPLLLLFTRFTEIPIMRGRSGFTSGYGFRTYTCFVLGMVK